MSIMLEVRSGPGSPIPVHRQGLRLQSDLSRVVALPLNYGDSVLAERFQRVMRVSDEDVGPALRQMITRFGQRHRDLTAVLERRWAQLSATLDLDPAGISSERRMLAAAYTTLEYSLEAAALCNPSVVPAPDQSGAGPGEMQVVLSLRAIGEGHRSSIEFRTGTIDVDGGLRLEPVGRWATLAQVSTPDSNNAYTVRFDPAVPMSERVLFPVTPDEFLGVEDARFVAMRLPDGTTSWAATYSGFNGRDITMKLVRTDDFTTFAICPMTGPGARDKGVALFPRQIGGKWWGLGRQDGQSLFLMTSLDLVHWETPTLLVSPQYDWELVQIGNCGSPIETDDGWLVITHGVGMLRRYVLGALLLDRDDPSIVVGRLPEPLLEPDDEEREGYVPNVLYSCGGLVHAGRLVLPYAYSDRSCSVVSAKLAEIIAAMR